MSDSESKPAKVNNDVVEMTKKEKMVKEVKSISLILLLVLVFRSSIAEPFRIPSGSMIPTLMIGDFILVNKLSYGAKIPFTDWNIFGFDFTAKYLFGKSDPERGDVIVFKYPRDKSINYIKRVVGLPGDKIEMRDKVIYINGSPVKTVEISGKEFMEDMDDKFKVYNFRFYKAEMGKANHVVQLDQDAFYQMNFSEKTVPAGHYFVMGDNRDYSSDSRFWGFVPRELIKGKALFVWFSMIFPLGEHPFKFRPWRIGTVIH
ncbi:MAG: signal peptidase I [Deltaproteobacteria bacterium]|nr:MAG: signal peptidase I [Deltaproteobacteria bacterium]